MASRPKYKLEQPEVTIAILGRAYVIDDHTGEILDWPEGEPRHMDRLVELAIMADQNAKRWADAAVGFKAGIRRLMDKAGVTSVKASTGDAAIMPVPNNARVPGGPGFVAWLKDVEFPPERYRDLLLITQAFNKTAFIALCEELGLEEEAIEEAIVRNADGYVRLTLGGPKPPRSAAPRAVTTRA